MVLVESALETIIKLNNVDIKGTKFTLMIIRFRLLRNAISVIAVTQSVSKSQNS